MNKKKKKIVVVDEKKKTNKNKRIRANIICKSGQVVQFDVNATKKFVYNDECYVIKKDCVVFKVDKTGFVTPNIFYYQGNPKPFKPGCVVNYGLSENELEEYISGDLFNILIECQKNDKSVYIFPLTVFVFVLSFIQFILIWV